MWEKCLGQKETIVLVQTDFNSVIGCYCPDQWEDTTGRKCSLGISNSKNIVSRNPFLFYFLDDQIQIMKYRSDVILSMGSDKDWLINFGWGIYISADKKKQSDA